MDKISGILPTSSRITTVDLKEAGAARPGAPNFGRPYGESNIERNSIVRSAHRALKRHRELMDMRSKDEVQANIAQKMSDQFFKSKHQLAQEKSLVQDLMAEELARTPLPPTVNYARTLPAQGESAELSSFNPEEDLNQPEVGRYLDVMG